MPPVSATFLIATRISPTAITREGCWGGQAGFLGKKARATARRYDEALRSLGLTNGQFSLMMALNRAQPPSIGVLARFLVMDRTTLTANLKPLERRGLVRVLVDKTDRRGRSLRLTRASRVLLVKALPFWRRAQSDSERLLDESDPDRLRAYLRALC
ncbi:MAG TPA: MarR family winged helix-turn-helix transcriptional regulator [Alphaproteobacteria bacterium]|nr:MarR family winged helix-turn-helix transcriptional regulator [Alphaproteobacteria bacterium]